MHCRACRLGSEVYDMRTKAAEEEHVPSLYSNYFNKIVFLPHTILRTPHKKVYALLFVVATEGSKLTCDRLFGVDHCDNVFTVDFAG